ncbi:MAG: DUF3108 domain-containing protein [Pseudomonadales bacterium]
MNRLAFITQLFLLVPVSAGATTQLLKYDAQISWLKAGELKISIDKTIAKFRTRGSVTTSRLIRPFFNWRGSFEGAGHIHDAKPITTYYVLAQTDRKGTSRREIQDKILVVEDVDGTTNVSEAPIGTDIISAIFVSEGCYQGQRVHDGEDSYTIRLLHSAKTTLQQATPYYSGQTRHCVYSTSLNNRKTRDVEVWSAPVGGIPTAVRIQVEIPRAPDGVLRLRTGE